MYPYMLGICIPKLHFKIISVKPLYLLMQENLTLKFKIRHGTAEFLLCLSHIE